MQNNYFSVGLPSQLVLIPNEMKNSSHPKILQCHKIPYNIFKNFTKKGLDDVVSAV